MWRQRALFPPFLLLLLLAASPALQAAEAAQQLVIDTSTRVLERLKADRDKLQDNPGLIYPLVEDLVLPHFDFERMSIWVLGKNWRRADAAQREQFVQQFRTLLVRTYAKALLEYTDQAINYLPFHAEADAKRVTVRTEVTQPGGLPIPIHYSMYLNKAGAWKVYDISVDGVSLVTNYRSSFASEIRHGGIDKLLERLVAMNEAKGGAGE
jgi:phospholipid transport system substrate-binding protein